jgi:hypothetical protein
MTPGVTQMLGSKLLEGLFMPYKEQDYVSTVPVSIPSLISIKQQLDCSGIWPSMCSPK